MKFAYITAALLGLAYANPIVSAPDDTSLDLLDARDDTDVVLLDEREDFDLSDDFDAIFSEFDEREAELDLDDDLDEETSVIEARGASSVLSALHKVRGDISGVNNALNKFSAKKGPSTSQALKVQKAADKLASDVKSATKKAKSAKKFSKKDTKKVFKFVKGSIKPATINSLSNFRKHAPGFKKSGFSSIAKSKLSSLKGNVGSLSNALINDAGTKKVKKQGKKIKKDIENAFEKTIKKF